MKTTRKHEERERRNPKTRENPKTGRTSKGGTTTTKKTKRKKTEKNSMNDFFFTSSSSSSHSPHSRLHDPPSHSSRPSRYVLTRSSHPSRPYPSNTLQPSSYFSSGRTHSHSRGVHVQGETAAAADVDADDAARTPDSHHSIHSSPFPSQQGQTQATTHWTLRSAGAEHYYHHHRSSSTRATRAQQATHDRPNQAPCSRSTPNWRSSSGSGSGSENPR